MFPWLKLSDIILKVTFGTKEKYSSLLYVVHLPCLYLGGWQGGWDSADSISSLWERLVVFFCPSITNINVPPTADWKIVRGVATFVRGVVTTPGASFGGNFSVYPLNCLLLPPHSLPLPLLLSRLAVTQHGFSPDNISACNYIYWFSNHFVFLWQSKKQSYKEDTRREQDIVYGMVDVSWIAIAISWQDFIRTQWPSKGYYSVWRGRSKYIINNIITWPLLIT